MQTSINVCQVLIVGMMCVLSGCKDNSPSIEELNKLDSPDFLISYERSEYNPQAHVVTASFNTLPDRKLPLDLYAGKRNEFDYRKLKNTGTNIDSLTRYLTCPEFIVENVRHQYCLLVSGVLECTLFHPLEIDCKITHVLDPADSLATEASYAYGPVRYVEDIFRFGLIFRLHYVWQEPQSDTLISHRITSNWLDVSHLVPPY